MASPHQPREVTPIWDRPTHAYADQFGHEWAWQFENELQVMVTAADGPEDLQRRITAQTERLGNLDLAANWRAFVNRKLAGVADPELGQDVEVIPPAGVRQPSRPTPTVAPHARGVAGPAGQGASTASVVARPMVCTRYSQLSSAAQE